MPQLWLPPVYQQEPSFICCDSHRPEFTKHHYCPSNFWTLGARMAHEQSLNCSQSTAGLQVTVCVMPPLTFISCLITNRINLLTYVLLFCILQLLSLKVELTAFFFFHYTAYERGEDTISVLTTLQFDSLCSLSFFSTPHSAPFPLNVPFYYPSFQCCINA